MCHGWVTGVNVGMNQGSWVSVHRDTLAKWLDLK